VRVPNLTARPRRRTLARREDLTGRALVSPTLLVVVLVVLTPFVMSLLYAFQDVRLIDIGPLGDGETRWTLDNFRAVLSSSGFWAAMRTTVLFAVVTTAGSVAAGLAIALALRKPFPGRGLVRALVLIPYVLPVVAAVMIWEQLLNSQYGFVNAFGERFLGWDEPVSFLSTTSMDVAGLPLPVTLLVVIGFEIWKTAPLAYLFITARLQAVPGDLEEAALIDGAAPSQSFRHVLLPQLAGVLALLAVLRFIWSFQSFNEIYLLTGGAGGTQVLAVRVYEELTTQGDIGAASALGLVMMAILTVLLIIYVRMSRREVAR
jgi:multiple sugar transport system permease protein